MAVLVLLENVLPRRSSQKHKQQHTGGEDAGGGQGWDRVGEGEDLSFLGPAWKDVAVPDGLAASCSGSNRYLHANTNTCAGVLVLRSLAVHLAPLVSCTSPLLHLLSLFCHTPSLSQLPVLDT